MLIDTKTINKLWDDGLYHNDIISNILPRWEFWKISWVLSLYEASEEEPEDKLYKFRFMMEELRENCKIFYSPSKYLSLGEASIGYNGKSYNEVRTRYKAVSSLCTCRFSYTFLFKF